jgi:hypothetical protein
MNQPLPPNPVQQAIIDLVPLLVELGRTADRSVLGDAELPNSWEFGVLWKRWDRVVNGWEATQVADLIRGLTYFERMFDRHFGSVPPVANLFRIYASMVESEERDRFADWILRNTVNDYTPYGTSNHGARSMEELDKKEAARFARKQATAAREQARFDEARCQRTIQATERLPNALRRKDAKAVAALVAKGADADAIGSSGQSAREIARDLGVAAWLSSDEKVDQQEANALPDLSGRAREIQEGR